MTCCGLGGVETRVGAQNQSESLEAECLGPLAGGPGSLAKLQTDRGGMRGVLGIGGFGN